MQGPPSRSLAMGFSLPAAQNRKPPGWSLEVLIFTVEMGHTGWQGAFVSGDSGRSAGGCRCSFQRVDGGRYPFYRAVKNSGSEATGVNLATLPEILLVAGLFIGAAALGWGVELAIRSYRRER